MDAGQFLRNRREELGLSQPELAERMSNFGYDTSKSRISHWEIGRNKLPLANEVFRVALALALDMDVTDLLHQLGYEVSEDGHSPDARLAADIIDVLPDNARRLAIAYLKLLKNEFSSAGD